MESAINKWYGLPRQEKSEDKKEEESEEVNKLVFNQEKQRSSEFVNVNPESFEITLDTGLTSALKEKTANIKHFFVDRISKNIKLNKYKLPVIKEEKTVESDPDETNMKVVYTEELSKI